MYHGHAIFHHGKEMEDIATYEIYGSCDQARVYLPLHEEPILVKNSPQECV